MLPSKGIIYLKQCNVTLCSGYAEFLSRQRLWVHSLCGIQVSKKKLSAHS